MNARGIALPNGSGVRAIREGITSSPAELVVLPEACWGGYGHVRRDDSEAVQGFLGEVCRSTGKYVAIGFLDGVGCAMALGGPDGRVYRYRKRFPSPTEARVWAPGNAVGLAPTPWGLVGLLICADVLHDQAWLDLLGLGVRAVLVSAAWPDYAGPAPRGLGWLWRESNGYRDVRLQAGADLLGCPVVLANASGPGFSGGAGVWMPGQETELRHSGNWRWFMPVYRALGRRG